MWQHRHFYHKEYFYNDFHDKYQETKKFIEAEDKNTNIELELRLGRLTTKNTNSTFKSNVLKIVTKQKQFIDYFTN